MELNKYKINRIKAGVIEDIADSLTSRLNSAQEALSERQAELQEMLQREEELRCWEIPEKKESVKQAEIYVATWQMLLDQLDKQISK